MLELCDVGVSWRPASPPPSPKPARADGPGPAEAATSTVTVSRKRTASPAKGGRAPHARADPDSAAAATASAATPGMRVSGFFGDSWDPGTIQVVHANGAFDVCIRRVRHTGRCGPKS